MPQPIFYKKYLLNIIVGFANLILVIAVIFAIKAVVKDSQELLSLRRTLFSLEKQEQDFVDLTRDYQENSEEIAIIEDSFSEIGAPVEFLNFLEETARATGLEIKTELYANPKTKTDIWGSIIIQLRSRGKSDKIIRFLDKIENNAYMAEIIEFTAKQSKDFIEGTFSIRVYVK